MQSTLYPYNRLQNGRLGKCFKNCQTYFQTCFSIKPQDIVFDVFLKCFLKKGNGTKIRVVLSPPDVWHIVDGRGGTGDSSSWILEDLRNGKVYLQKCFPSKLGPQNHFQSIALMFIKFVLNTSNCGRVHLFGLPRMHQMGHGQAIAGQWPVHKGPLAI